MIGNAVAHRRGCDAALCLKPIFDGGMPFKRFALSNVIEDRPDTEMVLLMDSDELESLSEHGIYILSVEEPYE
jgi:hypothetical protein